MNDQQIDKSLNSMSRWNEEMSVGTSSQREFPVYPILIGNLLFHFINETCMLCYKFNILSSWSVKWFGFMSVYCFVLSIIINCVFNETAYTNWTALSTISN